MPRFAFPSLCVLLAACAASDNQAAATLETRDSAGVHIVQNPEHAPAQWSVSTDPVVAIGSAAGDSAYQFDRVMGLVRLSDGRWVVGDMGSSQLRYYDAEGRHLKSAGRNGDGPGEFRQIMAVFRLRGDTLAGDDSHNRLQLFDNAGNFVATMRQNDRRATQYYPVAAQADGTIIALAQPAFPQTLERAQPYLLSYVRTELLRNGNAATLTVRDTLVTWPTIQLVPGWRGTTDMLQFHGRVDGAVLSDGFAVADPNYNEVRYYDRNGALRAIARRQWTRVAVTDEVKEEARNRMIDLPAEGGGRVPETLRKQRMEITKTWQFAEHLPAFTQMLAGEDGTLWLREFVPNEDMVGTWHAAPANGSSWSALDSAGTLLASLRLPARFKPLVFGTDFVAGLYRDEEDVEYVRVYRLQRS